MKRSVVVSALFISCLFLTQCGGETNLTSDAQDTSSDQVGNGEASEEPASLIHDPATGATVAANAGFAANGVVLGIPTGFVASQCRFTASLATLDGKSLSAQAGIDETTGEVICKKVVQERVEIPPEIKDCTASFTVICVK